MLCTGDIFENHGRVVLVCDAMKFINLIYERKVILRLKTIWVPVLLINMIRIINEIYIFIYIS